jgi:hypothetical protein
VGVWGLCNRDRAELSSVDLGVHITISLKIQF